MLWFVNAKRRPRAPFFMGADQILPLAVGPSASCLCYGAGLHLNVCKHMNHLLTIARREALLSVGLAMLYMLGWYGCAYLVPADMTWHGWPVWFVLSCVFNPLLFVGLCALMIKRYFKVVALDVPLDGEPVADDLSQAIHVSQINHEAKPQPGSEPKHELTVSPSSPLRCH